MTGSARPDWETVDAHHVRLRSRCVWARLRCLVEAGMKFLTTVVFVGALWPTPLAAQEFKTSENPVSDAVRQLVVRDSKNLIAAAELLPADKYSYHPTPAQMTFGQLIVHIVQTNIALCSGISGTPASLTQAGQTIIQRPRRTCG